MTSTFRLLTRQCCLADSPDRLAIDAGAGTRVGSQRQNNEDSYSVNAEEHIFVVADGIGGASAGEKASRMAADLLPRRLSPIASASDVSEEEVIEIIRAAFDETNAAILRAGRHYHQFHRMGTTGVMALIIDSRLYVASIGDSRAYLVRCGRVEQLTVDHTMAQALVEAAVISRNEALRHRWRNVLSKYLGHAQA